MKNKYILNVKEQHEKQNLTKPKLKRPKPKINIISINTGSVFDEYWTKHIQLKRINTKIP